VSTPTGFSSVIGVGRGIGWPWRHHRRLRSPHPRRL